MKIIQTSDWHLGRALCGRKRYEEFKAFPNWLADTIDRKRVGALLVVGDVRASFIGSYLNPCRAGAAVY